jgi:hypothetical protein
MQKILSGWNLMRLLRLGIGIYAIVGAIQQREWLFLLAGVFLAGMAIMNVGCCGVSCAAPPRRSAATDTPTTFEEIK